MSTSDNFMPPPPPFPTMMNKPVFVRSVWANNLEYEFSLIRSIIDRFPFVSMKTQFPSVIHRSDFLFWNPIDHYNIMRRNVNAIKLDQLGIMLTDASGNLPDFDGLYSFTWEFNFYDYDVVYYNHTLSSIGLLHEHGLHFQRIRANGIDILCFAEVMMASGLICNNDVSYITFHSGYDFGYLIKILTGRELPNVLPQFIMLMRVFFGDKVYDVKHMIIFCQNFYDEMNWVTN
ncbi:putative CCR4-associated factor 1 9 [Capsicum galapagoense]